MHPMWGRSCFGDLPIDITTVLAPARELWVKFDAGKDTLLAADIADEADKTIHVAGNIDGVTNGDIIAGEPAGRVWSHVFGAWLCTRARTVVDYGIVCVGSGDIGNVGERLGGQSGKGGLARQGGNRGRIGLMSVRVGCVEIRRRGCCRGSAQRTRRGRSLGQRRPRVRKWTRSGCSGGSKGHGDLPGLGKVSQKLKLGGP